MRNIYFFTFVSILLISPFNANALDLFGSSFGLKLEKHLGGSIPEVEAEIGRKLQLDRPLKLCAVGKKCSQLFNINRVGRCQIERVDVKEQNGKIVYIETQYLDQCGSYESYPEFMEKMGKIAKPSAIIATKVQNVAGAKQVTGFFKSSSKLGLFIAVCPLGHGDPGTGKVLKTKLSRCRIGMSRVFSCGTDFPLAPKCVWEGDDLVEGKFDAEFDL